MQDYVSAQAYALRAAGTGRFGYAWSPKNLAGVPTGDFNAQTDALLVRLAAAIADSGDTAGSRLRRELVHRQPRRGDGDNGLAYLRRLEAVPARVHLTGADGGAGHGVGAADRRAADEHRHGVHGRCAGHGRADVIVADGGALGEPERTVVAGADGADRLRLERGDVPRPRQHERLGHDYGGGGRQDHRDAGRDGRNGCPLATADVGRRGGGPAPDLVVQAGATPAAPAVGDTITYVVSVRNLGGDASRVSLAVQLPSQVAYAGSQSDRGAGCTGATTLTCDLDFLSGDLVATVRISAVVREAGTLTLTAVSSAQPADAQPANDTANVVTVVAHADRGSDPGARRSRSPCGRHAGARDAGPGSRDRIRPLLGRRRRAARGAPDAASLDAPADATRGDDARGSPRDEGASGRGREGRARRARISSRRGSAQPSWCAAASTSSSSPRSAPTAAGAR